MNTYMHMNTHTHAHEYTYTYTHMITAMYISYHTAMSMPV